ncbi:MAG: hypothetical protein HY659_12100 [Rhizobiales bacterium]|nr:hypothetical protein [Hyphomicrobiales bacterium]
MRILGCMRLAAAGLAIGFSLAACETFDPEKLTDWLATSKKPLPGECKPVFPEGVPGVSQGVPPELIKGSQPLPDAQPPAVVTAKPEAEDQPAEKPKPKPKPKKTVQQTQPAASPPAAQTAPWPAPQTQPAPSPWPSAPR